MAPTTIEEIEAMIRDQVQENVHLDYKDSRAIHDGARDDIAKDVSAFANSDGGVIVYGVPEKDNLPLEIDVGVAASPCSREWIEAAILTGVKPRIEDVRIHPILRSPGRFVYVVQVPKSFRGPHQASDRRYYKRHNFSSVPMEDYEIADLRLRRRNVPALISFEVLHHRKFFVVFDVRNMGDLVAEDVRFDFSPEIPWPNENGIPQPFRKGIQKLSPKQRLRFRYFAFHQILGEGSTVPKQFSVRISYFHPEIGCRLSDEWFVDFEAYRDSMGVSSETEEQMRDAIEGLKKLTEQIERLRRTLEPLQEMIGPTGLRLSISTIRNLKRILHDGSSPELLDPVGCGPNVFGEVLGVNQEIAMELYRAFSNGIDRKRLEGMPGITDELMENLRRHFRFSEDEHVDEQRSTLP